MHSRNESDLSRCTGFFNCLGLHLRLKTEMYSRKQAIWAEYAGRFGTHGLNGHYDYRAARFWIEDGRWFLEYECEPGHCGDDRPSTILFTSSDEGVTYTITDDAVP